MVILPLVGAPLLLWRRTRLAVFLVYVVFHTTNHFSFNIGILPGLTLFGTLVFFEPDWPRRIWRALTASASVAAQEEKCSGRTNLAVTAPAAVPLRTRCLMSGLLAAWFSFQVLVPLRHLLYPGNVSWTEEGHRFAWHMLLQFAHHLARVWGRENNQPGVEVRVKTAVSLNGRRPVALLDPDRNLAAVLRDLRSADW